MQFEPPAPAPSTNAQRIAERFDQLPKSIQRRILGDVNRIDTLFQEAFDRTRSPCSAEYKAGVRAGIAQVLLGDPVRCPYEVGALAHEAFSSGLQEGRDRARTANAKAVSIRVLLAAGIALAAFVLYSILRG